MAAASLDLPEYPFHPSHAMREDPSLLARLLESYRKAAGTTEDAAEFLFGYAPIHAFDEIFDSAGHAAAGEEMPWAGHVWLMHISGYFGGVWLRAEIRRAQPQNPVLQAGLPPTRESFEAVASRAHAAQVAALANPEAQRSYLEAALPELVAGFGYNQGYLLQIVEQPPGRVESPPDVIRPRGPLCCSYDDPRLQAIEALAPAAEKLATGAAGWEEHAQSIPAQQAESEKSGRGVWSTGLSVEGFTPAGYAQLLALSSSFLEVTQAVALSALTALCEGDTDSGRRAALAHACLLPWTGSYAMGLMDPRPDDLATGAALPRIIS